MAGALLPFASKDDLTFCSTLEMHLRQEAPPLCGRDQLFFRSSYFPVKGVVDGDYLGEPPPPKPRHHTRAATRWPAVRFALSAHAPPLLCAGEFAKLSPEEQTSIAADLDRTPAEIAKKLEELASRIL